MLAILPVAALAALTALCHSWLRLRGEENPLRFGILIASTIWGVTLLAITEFLGAFNLLATAWLASGWGLVLAAALWQLGRLRHAAGPACPPPSATWFEKLSVVAIAAIAIALLVIVLVAAPNNYDSITYHLPRVMQWVQNRSVSFFTTPDARQICFPPWAEYHILHYQLLLGSDRLAALPQWLAYVGAVIAGSLLAKQLGASRRFQTLAATLVATMPMAILQATSTQNDLTAGFWLLASVSLGLKLAHSPGLGYALAFGAATGLALLTKTTAYLYAFPFLVAVSAMFIARHRSRALLPLAAAGLCALCINIPHYARNMTQIGNPLGSGPHYGIELTNTHIGPRTLLSNALRNAGLHALTPSTRINDFIELGIRFAHKLIRADINDPATTFFGNRYETKWLSTFEDDAANPIHFLLIIVLFSCGCFLFPRGEQRARFLLFAAASVGGAALFCAVLQWQPWHSRQHVGLFLCAIPVAAAAIERVRAPAWSVTALSLVLFAAATPHVLGNETRPLLFPMSPSRYGAHSILTTPRGKQYLISRPIPASWQSAFSEIHARGFRSVGMKINWFTSEYPLWLLAKSAVPEVGLGHIESGKVPLTAEQAAALRAFHPDSILAVNDHGGTDFASLPATVTFNGIAYQTVWNTNGATRADGWASLYAPSAEPLRR